MDGVSIGTVIAILTGIFGLVVAVIAIVKSIKGDSINTTDSKQNERLSRVELEVGILKDKSNTIDEKVTREYAKLEDKLDALRRDNKENFETILRMISEKWTSR